MHYLYFIKNTINSKIYVGHTNNPAQRKYQYKHNFLFKKNIQLHLMNAMKKYGYDNFYMEIVETYETMEQVCLAEIAWISRLKDNGIELYNMTSGGEPLFNMDKIEQNSGNKETRKEKFYRKIVEFDNDFSHLDDEE